MYLTVSDSFSKPYLQVIQTIQPLGKSLDLSVQIDTRLSKRVLSSKPMSDWMDKLRASFDNLDLKYPGGESSKEAMDRIVHVVMELLKSEHENIVIVTYGNIISLLFHYFDGTFYFEQWKGLTNLDVYLLNAFDGIHIKLTRILFKLQCLFLTC